MIDVSASERSRALQAASVVGLGEAAAEILERDRPLYALVLGESDLPTPAHIVDAGRQALANGFTFYPPGSGFEALRQAIAVKLRNENNLIVDPQSQIFVTNGSGAGLFLALLAVADPGDEIIVSDPTYGPFLDAIRLAGTVPVFASLVADATGQWRWTSKAIENVVTPRTAALIYSTPSAPHGSVLTESELRALGEAAVGANFALIADEVFEHLTFDGHKHLSIAALDPAFAARTVSVFSFSKSYLMTGWRLGYNVGPPHIVSAIERLSMTFGRAAAAFTQQAGIAALSGTHAFIAEMRREYAMRRTAVEAALRDLPGIDWLTPEGAFYVFLDFSSYGPDSASLSLRLLHEASVMLTPGAFYGPRGQGWLRLSFAGPLEHTLAGIGQLRVTLRDWRDNG